MTLEKGAEASGCAAEATGGRTTGGAAAGDVFAARVRGAEFVLLRILSVRPSVAGSNARVRFEYKSL